MLKNNDKTLKEQLIDIIKNEIEEGVYNINDALPREIDYQEKYNVSRITVRSAMSELQNLGYIEKIKGKGTFVKRKKISEPLLKIESFTDEMKQKGLIPTTKDSNISIVGADKQCSEIFNIPINTPVYKLTRIRLINNMPIAFFTTYLKTDFNLTLDSSVYNSSLYDYLNKQNIYIKKVKQYISANSAGKEMVEKLKCIQNEPILVLKRIGFIDDTENPYEYTIAQYVGSKYEYYFELYK